MGQEPGRVKEPGCGREVAPEQEPRRGQHDMGMDMARYRDQGGCRILGRYRSLGCQRV